MADFLRESREQQTSSTKLDCCVKKPELADSSPSDVVLEVQNENPAFSSSFGIVLSCLGCVVGTGNIWRFPRIAAQNSYSQGSLTFLLVWIIFLGLWSMPMIMIEYAVGRYCKSSPLKCFYKFLGKKAVWCGGWVTMVTFLISCYYSVVLGWCFYYFYYSLTVDVLPVDESVSLAVFEDFVKNSYWPVVTHLIAVLLAGLCVIGGISWIEKANMVLVPTLLGIVIFTFGWAMTMDYADYAILFLFTPNWESIKDPRLWVDAASQNAFDTGAGMGLFVPYASYMTRKNGVVKFASMIPLSNNFVSILCALTIFPTVFATLISTTPTLSRTGILEIIKTSGPGSTGLTFIWIPVLFARVGIMGRILCSLFFFCLSCAGVSSLIANIELTSLTLTDFGLPRRIATPVCMVATFAIGLGSAFNIMFLTNQDFVWGFALILSGVMFQILVIFFGVFKFREIVVNKFGIGDWNLPISWSIIVQVIAPLEAIGLLVWWGYDLISNYTNKSGERWFEFGTETFITTLMEWLILLAILLVVNLILIKRPPKWFDNKTVGQILMSSDKEKHENIAEHGGSGYPTSVSLEKDKQEVETDCSSIPAPRCSYCNDASFYKESETVM